MLAFFSPFSPGPFALQVRWLFCVILRPVAVLALFGYPGHILVYAPGDILTSPPCHKPDDLADSFSVFDGVEVHEGLTGKKRKAYSAMDGANRICVILRSVAVLVALSIPGHILVYAPRNPSHTALPQTG